MISLDAARRHLIVDGDSFPLSIAEFGIVRELIESNTRIITRPAYMRDSLKQQICHIRRKTPLAIVCLGRGAGYELIMQDHTKTRPEVEHAITRVKGIFKESDVGMDLELGPRVYDHKTGKASITAGNKDVQIDIVVKPQETK